MIFSKQTSNLTITAFGTPLERVTDFKLVGVNVCSDLKWDNHCNKVINKIRPVVWSLYKIKNRLDTKNKLLLYNALITSQISYCLPIWQGCTEKSQASLQVLMNKAQRAVFNLGPRETTRSYATDSRILTLTSLAKYATCTLVRATTLQSAISLKTFFPRKPTGTSGKTLRSDLEDQLLIPPFKTKLEELQLPIIASYTWNSIPEDLKSQSYDTFKKNLKNYYLSYQL